MLQLVDRHGRPRSSAPSGRTFPRSPVIFTLDLMMSAVLDRAQRSCTAWWLLANVAVAGAFLGVASFSWIEPELAEYPGASGGAAVVWFMTAVPVFLASGIGNLCMLAWGAVRRHRAGAWPFGAGAWLIPLLWLAVFFLDNSRHGA